MTSVFVDDHEFVIIGEPNPAPAPEPNVLDMVSPWWGLGTPSQLALRWAVQVGGTAYASNLVALRSLASRGLVVVDEAGRWSATDAGRELLAGANS